MRLLQNLRRGANFTVSRFILHRRGKGWGKHNLIGGGVFIIIITILVGRSGRIGRGVRRERNGNVIGKHGHKLVIVKAVKGRRRVKKSSRGGVTTLIGKRVGDGGGGGGGGFKESNGVANGSPVKAAAGGGEVEEIIEPGSGGGGGGGRRRGRRR